MLHRPDELVLVGEGVVGRVLLVGRGPPVPDGEAHQVDARVLLFVQECRNGRDVVSGIGLAGDEELSALEFRVFLKESLEEEQEVLGDLGLIPGVISQFGLGIASAYRLVNIEHVGMVVPRMLVT